MPTENRFLGQFWVKNKNGETIGLVFGGPGQGWKYSPFYQAQMSRKYWDTPGLAIQGRVKGATLVPRTSDTIGH